MIAILVGLDNGLSQKGTGDSKTATQVGSRRPYHVFVSTLIHPVVGVCRPVAAPHHTRILQAILCLPAEKVVTTHSSHPTDGQHWSHGSCGRRHRPVYHCSSCGLLFITLPFQPPVKLSRAGASRLGLVIHRHGHL